MLLFSTKIGSCRQIRDRFWTPTFLSNLKQLTGENFDKVPHQDTLSYLVKKLKPEELSHIRYQIMQGLIRSKALVDWRLMDKWYLISVDGTGYLKFKEKKRHEKCDKCMTRKLNDGKTLYHHPVLEAKLVTANGFALSVGTEFMENTDGNEKQDCETTALKRWMKELKRLYPQLRICLLLDGLFANRPIYKLCKEYGWKYIITFKEGCSSDLYKWYMTVRDRLYQKNYKEVIIKDGIQKFRWISPFEHFTGEIFHIFECEETIKGKTKHFVWITNIEVTEANVVKLANQGGRLRWKSENEGHNIQKNGGYEMEHAYSTDPTGLKNFYLLLQIAHIIDQLLQKSNLLKAIRKEIGAMKNIAFHLLESLRTEAIVDLTFLDERFQIRFESG